MARTRRVKTLDEKIAEAEQLIQKKQDEITVLTNRLEELKQQKQNKEMQKLYELIAEKGMTVEEVIDLVK